MTLTIILLVLLITLVSIAIIGAVFLQNPKDQGAGPLGTVNNMQKLVGAAHVPNILEKITYGLLATLMVLCLGMTYMVKPRKLAEEDRAKVHIEQKKTPRDAERERGADEDAY